MKHKLTFALGYLRSPRRVGAIAPASQSLASAIAREVRGGAAQVVIEAGAGTGAITRELAREGAGIGRLIVYELDPRYASLLRVRHPGLEIRNECASRMRELALHADQPVTVLSSLPLLSMPKAEVRLCVAAFLDLVARHPLSRLIQYTYAHPWLRPFPVTVPGLRWRRAATVWANLPPAHVWSLEHAADHAQAA